MRITHVECHLVRVPGPNPPFAWRQGLPGSWPDGMGAVLRICTDEGAEGVAFAPRKGVIVQDIVDRLLRTELIGADPYQREWLWHRMWELDRVEEMPLYVLGLADVALWDLAAKVVAQPVWQLLGGYRTEIPAQASTVTFGTVEEYLDVADQVRELGFTSIKLHAWGDWRRDAKLCAALREHVGDDFPLAYDGSAGFDLADAIRLGHVLSDAGYLWYEEPMREFSVTAYKWLGEKVAVPLLVGETSDGAHMNTADFVASGAATAGVRTSTELRGGFTGAMRIAHLADAYRLRAEVHGPIIPHQHLCMAVPNNTYYESLITATQVRREDCVGADGLVRAPQAPGVGLPSHLDYPAALAAHV
ncbi:enolase C-terminal domain-like protein [Amycolatopsis sp. NPDC058278]|uniref:enolase C-terminal domain-like protein n=1 Tax=Amycolatopsis sp. NPDC058278 TaxID=3346417 RepID=UPI0036DF29E3